MNDIFEEYRLNNSAENRIFGVVNRARFSVVREAKKRFDNIAFVLAGAALALSGQANASSFKDLSKVDLHKPATQIYFDSADIVRVSGFSKSNIHSDDNLIIDYSGYEANTKIDSGFDEVSSPYGLNIKVSDTNLSNFPNDRFEDIPVFNAYLAPYWLSDFLKADRAGDKRAALNHLMDAIDFYEISSNWSEFCQVLDNLNVSSLSNTALVGLLRNTFVFRDEIPAWKPFSRKVSDVISTRGANVDRVMSGLLV